MEAGQVEQEEVSVEEEKKGSAGEFAEPEELDLLREGDDILIDDARCKGD